jgi:spoIIIJ-associated protein
MQPIEQTGRTVEEAVKAALKTLGLSREEVEVEVLAEQSRGLLGILGYSEAKVRVTPRAGAAHRALEILTETLRLMGLDAKADITDEDAEAVNINIHDSPDLGLLIGKRGQTLAALQLIVAVVANRGQPPERRRRIILDAEGYRARRDRALQDMALDAAERARRTGRPVTLESLNPRERRVVHLALADDPRVTTRSEGQEPNRSVVISAPRNRSG